ncbi:MAG: hypothetical protein J5548_00140 [Prevotella sp.]|nr:hypothetical protein [Prevotella sp.]
MDEKELLTVWLADKILDTVKNEDEVQGDAILYAQNVILKRLKNKELAQR